MTRVLSALVLLPVIVAAIWFLPPVFLLAIAELVVILAFTEYARLAERIGIPMPKAVAGAAAVVTCAVYGWPDTGPDIILMTAVVAVGAIALTRYGAGPAFLPAVAAALFAPLYLGLPLGALVAIRITLGREALLLLLLTVVVSDTAQYYTGRLLGRRLLAPAISPKKTIEGLVGGIVFGSLAMVIGGGRWLPGVPVAALVALGSLVVVLGVTGDLFESSLKRSAGVKDSSALIPGHGGVLDRIDALLFAAPGYFVFLRYGWQHQTWLP